MKINFTLSLIFCLAIQAFAQTPQYFKGLGISNSTFLFGYPTDCRHSQCIYTPWDLQFPPSGSVTAIYYRYGSTQQDSGNTMYNFRVGLLSTADTGFRNSNLFFTGTTNVLTLDSLVIPPGATGNWFMIPLSTQFNYDNSQSLVVELRFDSVRITEFGTLGTDNNGRKLISGDSISATGSTTSIAWQDFGFDEIIDNGVNDMNGRSLFVSPNPFLNSINISVPENFLDATIDVIDITGKKVLHRENVRGNLIFLNASQIPRGVYLLRVTTNDGEWEKKILKVE